MYFLTGLVKIMNHRIEFLASLVDHRKQTGRKSVVRKRAIISFNDKHPKSSSTKRLKLIKLRSVKPACYNVVHGDSDDLTENGSAENESKQTGRKSVVKKPVNPSDDKPLKCSGRICFI